MNNTYIQAAKDYKKNIAGKFVLVEGSNLKQRIGGEQFFVTRKIDGHLQIAFYDNGISFLLNSNGKQKAENIKCIDVFTQSLKKAGIKLAVIATELYLPCADGRPRHGDVARALADDTLKNDLCLAPFDIVEINGESWTAENYGSTHKRLCEIFTDEVVRPVEMRIVSDIDGVKEIYTEWIETEGAEGMVVHSEGNIVWKIKPRHTIDAAVVGYTTGDRGVRDLMFAVRRDDGFFQIFGVGSSGLSDEQRDIVARQLSENPADSQYILSDSRGIAYQMVKPEKVFEISVLELVPRGNDDKIRMNPLLKWDDQQGWILEGNSPGVSVLGITVEREREDKRPDLTDIRVSQLTDIVTFEEIEASASRLEGSTLLERKVYKKVSGAKVMVHKFLLWKTNKESSGQYPAYVIYHTDFSSGRKEMIKRDMAYTSDEKQAREIFEAEIAANIKKGWEEVFH